MSGAVETGETLSAVAIKYVGKHQLLKFIISRLVSVATSGVSLKFIVVRIFDLWLFAADILSLLCSQLVVVEVVNSTERQNVIVCVVLSMVLMQLFDKAFFLLTLLCGNAPSRLHIIIFIK